MRDEGLFAVWTPYPPLFSLFLYGYTTIFSDWDSFFLSWKVLNIVMVLAIGFLIYMIVKRRNREMAFPAAFGYVLINATTTSAITIGFYFDQFDYLPIFIAMASLYMLMIDRPVESAWLCGIGTMTKLFPVMVLPIAVISQDLRKRVWYVLFFALACLIAVLPWLIANPRSLRSSYEFTRSRDAWETIWTWPHINTAVVPLANSLAIPYGDDSNPYSWLIGLAAAATLGCLWWQRKDKTKEIMPKKPLSLVLVLLIFSKGVSSYYIFWIFPLFVVYKPIHAFVACAVLLLVGNIELVGVDIQPLTYWISIFARHAIFLTLLLLSLIHRPFGQMIPLSTD